MTGFNLREKRNELFAEMVIPLNTDDEVTLLNMIESAIEKQDKEFIKLLNEELEDTHGSSWIVQKVLIDKLTGYKDASQDKTNSAPKEERG